MENVPAACVILAAGKGTRMKSSLPKVMHPLANQPMISHVLHTARALAPQKTAVVLGEEMDSVVQQVKRMMPKAEIVIQQEQLGTGHAVRMAEGRLKSFKGIVYILYGDTPLIEPDTLHRMAAVMQKKKAAVVVLGMRPADPAAYGRLVADAKGNLQKIVEYKDADAREREIDLCNSGVMAVQAKDLWPWLRALNNDNAKQEYYLTDIVAMAVAEGKKCSVVEAEEEELLGVNDRVQLAQAEAVLQRRLREQAMQAGATLIDPDTVYFSADIRLGRDVLIEPHVWFGEGVTVENNVIIRAFSHIEGATIEKGATVGPYARLRPGAEIGRDVRVGNFVEIKKAVLEEGAKVSHLSYIGDANVGAHANVGAGTITCNYDGYDKYFTSIGKHAFIGSNTALVAPVTVGDGAIVGAGSVITEDVEGDAMSLSRATQQHKQAWAKEFRRKKRN